MVDLLGIFEVADVVVAEVELHPTNRAGEVVLAVEGVVSVTGEALSLPMSRVSSAEKSDQRDLAPNSVRNVIAPLRALLATAVEEGLIRSNPAAGLRLATRRPSNGEQAEELAKALTPDELAALIEATPEGWRRLLVQFTAATGMRISEVIALRWKNVDLDAGRVQVRERLYRGEADQPKSKYGRRDVPISRSMAQALREHRIASRHSGVEDFVFASLRGTAHRPENLSRRVLKPSAERAGVAWVGWHPLRHTCASNLFRAGANAKQVQLWLGHHSPSFTLATYVHLLPDDMPTAALLDEAVGLKAGLAD